MKHLLDLTITIRFSIVSERFQKVFDIDSDRYDMKFQINIYRYQCTKITNMIPRESEEVAQLTASWRVPA